MVKLSCYSLNPGLGIEGAQFSTSALNSKTILSFPPGSSHHLSSTWVLTEQPHVVVGGICVWGAGKRHFLPPINSLSSLTQSPPIETHSGNSYGEEMGPLLDFKYIRDQNR